MNPFVAEFLGTMLLVLIGDGVCANASLTRTKGHQTSNWLFVNAGWGLAVFVAVLCTSEHSGAHLNPAVTIGLTAAGQFGWLKAIAFMVAQFAGALLGAVLVYLFYIQHFAVTDDPDAKLGSFCTAPAIRGFGHNLFSEIIGTFVLVFAVLMTVGASVTMEPGSTQHPIGLGALGAIPVALVVFAIGMGLGGTSGYAINPARDFSPRLAHQLLPIPNKRDSDWAYAWVPFFGPMLGGVLAAVVYVLTVSS